MLNRCFRPPAVAFQAIHPPSIGSVHHCGATGLAAADPFTWQGRLPVEGKVSWVWIDSI
jgi:hypothetical protein